MVDGKDGVVFNILDMQMIYIYHLRKNHIDLWNKLLELEKDTETIGNMWNILTKTKIHDWEEIFQMEDAQLKLF